MYCIEDDIRRLQRDGILETLLRDRTTEKNIIWATDAYAEMGPAYARESAMEATLITNGCLGTIRTRAEKGRDQRTARTRQHGEVFTPTWVCKKMNDYADEAFFGEPGRFDTDGPVRFDGRTWEEYVDSARLEITCGEAPYLVSRYDAATGEEIPFGERIGLLDRKLRVVGENAPDEAAWTRWAMRALQATYGYEFQGDNLLIARINVLCAFEEALAARWHRAPTAKEYRGAAGIIAWNLWQMDGLTGTIPCYRLREENKQLDMFALLAPTAPAEPERERPPCKIRNWRKDGAVVEYKSIADNRRGTARQEQPAGHGKEEEGMKFDFVIGNPPYQDETNGEKRNYAPPNYDSFMDEAYKICDIVELIHPARFLFNAGSTSKDWNKKMLNDPHLKVLYYEPDSEKVFPGLTTPLKGGVAITYRDKNKNYGAIGTFSKFKEMNFILKKVRSHEDYESLDKIVYSRTSYHLTDVLHRDYPDAITKLSKGHAYDMSSNIFTQIPEVFLENRPNDGEEYIQIIGREGERTTKYIKRAYVNTTVNLFHYKVFVAQATGIGSFGETMSSPIIAGPGVGHTETFLSIGNMDTLEEAEALEKYIKTKFLRSLRSVLKVTQNGNKPVWKLIPLQDFTPTSDIDWSQSIADIDRQLYAKYGLDEQEIEFIETHVKEMA